MKKIIICITLLSLFVPALLFSQEGEVYALLEYFEDEYEIQIYHPDISQVSEIITIDAGQAIQKNYNLSR